MDTFLGAPRYATTTPPEAPGTNGLARHLCQVTGLNQNYTSRVGTPYHVQIEDRGPLMDAPSEQWVRRVNVIVYANYGEPNARIVHISEATHWVHHDAGAAVDDLLLSFCRE